MASDMHGILHPRLHLVRRPGDGSDVDLDALTNDFLGEMRRSAVDHFDRTRDAAPTPINILTGDCRTVQMSIPATESPRICGGTIVAHVSGPAFAVWAAAGTGSPAEREEQVLGQLQLVLQDLSDHDVQGCLTLTSSQCDAYDLDLRQLVAESLDRTTFSHLQRQADVHWEGTFVRSLDPPALVLVVSIDLQVPA